MRSLHSTVLVGLASAFQVVSACDSCYGPSSGPGAVIHERNVRRMQPEASGALSGPKAPLEWGQLNFLHTVSISYALSDFQAPIPLPFKRSQLIHRVLDRYTRLA